MQVPAFDWSKPQRQSPVALLFIIWRILKESWIAILLVFGKYLFRDTEKTKSKFDDYAIYYALGFFALILLIRINHLIQFFRFRLYVQQGELVVISGVLSKTKAIIPLDRVQSVHLKQNYVHRFTNTCGLKLETAGSAHTEVEIDAIDLQKAMALQQILQQQTSIITSVSDHQTAPAPMLGISTADVLKLAISENHIKTLLLILFFALARMEDLRQYFGVDAEKVIGDGVEKVLSASQLWALLIAAVLTITLAVSFARVLIRYYAMQLRISEKGFQMQWGFLQTQQKMLVHNKVQMLSWNSNWIRGLLGIRIVRFFMAGEDVLKDGQWIRLPVMQQNLLHQIIAPYQSVWPTENGVPHKVHHAYGWRMTVLIGLPVCILLSVLVCLWKLWLVICPILAFVYYAISNLIAQRNFQYWYNYQTIQITKGVWGREHVLLNLSRVQHVEVKTSPYLRAKQLATLVLHTAGDTVEIPYISLEQANYLADCCLLNIEFDLSSSSFASE